MKNLSLPKSLLLAASIAVPANAATIFQSSNITGGNSWNAAFWGDPAEVPTAGNDYVNAEFNETRANGGEAFLGDSLEMRFGRFGLRQGTSSVNLIMNPGTSINQIAGGSFILNGTITTAANNADATSTFGFDTGADGRSYTVNSQLTIGSLQITTIRVDLGGATGGAADTSLTITNALNSFSGLWDVQQGTLLGTNIGALGLSSFGVGSDGGLDLDYDFSNSSGDLTIATGGTLTLDQALTFGTSTIGGNTLSAGTYDAAALTGFGINATGAGLLTVVPEPSSSALLGLGLASLFVRRRRS